MPKKSTLCNIEYINDLLTSDILDLDDVIDPARLSSTSPSSDSIDMALLAAADDESMETLSGRPEIDPEAVEFNGSRLRPTDDSLRNCSKNDI